MTKPCIWGLALSLLLPTAATAQTPETPGWHARVDAGGRVQLLHGRRKIGTIAPGLYEDGWRGAGYKGSSRPPDPGKPHQGINTACK